MSEHEGQGCGDEPSGFPQLFLVTKWKRRPGQEQSWVAFWRGPVLQQLQGGCDAGWLLLRASVPEKP